MQTDSELWEDDRVATLASNELEQADDGFIGLDVLDDAVENSVDNGDNQTNEVNVGDRVPGDLLAVEGGSVCVAEEDAAQTGADVDQAADGGPDDTADSDDEKVVDKECQSSSTISSGTPPANRPMTASCRLSKYPDFQTFGSFAMMDDELTVTKVGKGTNGRTTPTTVRVSAPFFVLGYCRYPQGEGWGKLIRYSDADGQNHDRVVTEAALHGFPYQVAGELAAAGLNIDRTRQKEFVEYLNAVEPPDRVTLVKQTGWHRIRGENVFVHPTATFGGDGLGEKVMLNGGTPSLYAAEGSLADWISGVATLARSQPWLIVAVSAAFAGPLLKLVGGEGGGLHFYGTSSIGKSSLLAAAASVWGRGDERAGYIRSWRATANGVEGLAASASDTLLVLDEVGLAAARDVDQVVYTLGSGLAKQRARKDGSAETPLNFRLMVLSSGEVTIETKLAEDQGRKERAGQTVRIVNIAGDREKKFGVFDSAGGFVDAQALSDAVKTAAATAYGTAGVTFVKGLAWSFSAFPEVSLLRASERARRLIDVFIRRYTPKGAAEQVGRVARKFALIAAAGELATYLKITNWDKGEAWRAASMAFKTWIVGRGGTGSHEESQAIAQVRLCIEMHGQSRFEPLPNGPAGMPANLPTHPIANRLGWRSGSGTSELFFVPPEAWAKELCRGLNPTVVARALAKRGMLVPSNTGQVFSRSVTIAGQKVRVYVLTAAILA